MIFYYITPKMLEWLNFWKIDNLAHYLQKNKNSKILGHYPFKFMSYSRMH